MTNKLDALLAERVADTRRAFAGCPTRENGAAYKRAIRDAVNAGLLAPSTRAYVGRQVTAELYAVAITRRLRLAREREERGRRWAR